MINYLKVSFKFVLVCNTNYLFEKFQSYLADISIALVPAKCYSYLRLILYDI